MPEIMYTEKNVAVLVCTYNGAKFINKQLDSIINQSHLNWTLYISDDGSTDGTLDILDMYQEKIGKERMVISKGPGKGFAWNFLSLLKTCPSYFDYYAFSDQDDVWLPEKLSEGIKSLYALTNETAAIHCGRTILIDEKDECIGYSPIFKKKPSFQNALIQSIAGGNTMMLNNKAKEIIDMTPKYHDIISHDWWIYILITGCGGDVIYDENPLLKYRQHTNNIIGSNLGWKARLRRINGLFDGHFQMWIQKNIDVLTAIDVQLSEKNQWILSDFIEARTSNIVNRVFIFAKIKLYRQTFFGTLAFYLAILLKKI
ncbi:glycosyltransferase family 2 protein [Escherichia coli]|uniref:glycosyltransferase family 2 protein n=1 Tax=Citrobacter sp. Cb016 TaxID=2985015 RepID=UPI00257B17C1|nr:glycosyltransferase family 2 protein [Citrobacter sp. Cb016]ELX9580967.1 glycosyltransferase family 2 protein [Escherichia coli]MDM3397777.1 glycosyltransferase family 2 protein [Citrobacter sp. Cb016]